MSKVLLAALGAATALAALPAAAHESRARHVTDASIYTDSNSHYLDYKTDISEAKRELESDLRRANDEADRVDAYAEYDREVADAEHDFRKEMAEKGIAVPSHSVRLEEVAMVDR